MVAELVEGTPNFPEWLAAEILHTYPLKSGGASIAISKTLARMAGSRNVNLWAKVDGGQALVPSMDLVGRSMFFVGDLDPKVSWVVDRFAKIGDIALDIGANLGLVTLRLAKKVGRSGKVHSFEPNPAILQYLDATVARHPSLQIELHRIALGSSPSTLSLMVPKANAGAASLISVRGIEVDHTIDVPVVRLDDFLQTKGMDRVDFIKMDVEGFEEEVLKGAAWMLENLRPRVILLEEHGRIYGSEMPPSLRILADLGYTLFGLPRRFISVKLMPFENVKSISAHDFVAFRDPPFGY